MEKRNTAQDWRTAYKDAQNHVERIENQIVARLRQLVKAHPEAIIGYKADIDRTPLKAKLLTDNYLDGISTESALRYIEAIEKHLSDQHPHQQLKAF